MGGKFINKKEMKKRNIIIVFIISIILLWAGMLWDISKSESPSFGLEDIMMLTGLISGISSGIALVIIFAEEEHLNM